MAELDYTQCPVLLFDPVGPNLSSTRTVLKGLGFDRVDGVREFADLTRHLSDGHFPLVVAEVTDAGGDIAGLMRRLRGGELGSNAFAIVILTSWSRAESDVRAGVDGGADDVLLRPFSPAGLRERIDTFARRRKPFVVTGDYLGPDRRRDPKRASGVQTFDVPNALNVIAEQGYSALRRYDAEVREASARIDMERIKRLAIRIAAGARLREAGEKVNEQVANEELTTCSRELRRRIRRRCEAEAVEMVTALGEVIARVVEDAEASKDQLAMIADLALKTVDHGLGEEAGVAARVELDLVLKALAGRSGRRNAAA